MKKEYFECGKILCPHGVRGLMKIESWCDTPKVLAAQKRIFFAEKDGGYREAKVLSGQVSAGLVLMSIEGIEDREVAQGLKGVILYLKREDIPVRQGCYLLADIIGLPAINFDTGESLGVVSDITEAARGRLYVIKTETGREVLIPDVPVFIKKIDLNSGVMISPIPGFFEDV
jgi:16S rRNA processing protein RimM